MATGKKSGGRKAGTPNKRTQDVIDKLAELDCDPIESLGKLAQAAEKEGDKSLAARLYAELAPYTAPKRKAVEQTIMNEELTSREELEANYREAMKKVIKEYEAMSEAEKQALMGKEH